MSFSFPFQKIQKIKSTHRIVVHVQRDDIMRLDQYQALSKNPKYQLLQWQSRHIQFKIVNLKKKKKTECQGLGRPQSCHLPGEGGGLL